MPDPSRASRSTRPVWLLVALLLLVAIVVPLLVPIYDREGPAFLGFPFFFWFQFLLIPIASVLTFIAFRLSQAATARDRQAHGKDAPAEEVGQA